MSSVLAILMMCLCGAMNGGGNEIRQSDAATQLVLEVAVPESTGPEQWQRVLVTVRNRDLQEPLYDVQLMMVSDETTKAAVEFQVGVLEPSQSQVVRFWLHPKSTQPYITAFYNRAGRLGSVARTIPERTTISSSPVNPTTLTFLGGVLSTLAGGYLTHTLTSRRDRTRAEFELKKEREKLEFDWRKADYTRQEAEYASFLRTWGNSTTPQPLLRAFEKLDTSVIVTNGVREAVLKAAADMQATTTETEKQQAVHQVRQAVVDRLHQLQPGTMFEEPTTSSAEERQ